MGGVVASSPDTENGAEVVIGDSVLVTSSDQLGVATPGITTGEQGERERLRKREERREKESEGE